MARRERPLDPSKEADIHDVNTFGEQNKHRVWIYKEFPLNFVRVTLAYGPQEAEAAPPSSHVPGLGAAGPPPCSDGKGEGVFSTDGSPTMLSAGSSAVLSAAGLPEPGG